MDENMDQSRGGFRAFDWVKRRKVAHEETRPCRGLQNHGTPGIRRTRGNQWFRACSDEEYLEKLRGSIRWWDRWRWVGVAINLIMIGATLYLANSAMVLVKGMQQMELVAKAPSEVPVLLGVALGFQLGFLMHTAVLGAFFGLRGLRNERLLLKYFDACREPGLGERGVAVGEDGQP